LQSIRRASPSTMMPVLLARKTRLRWPGQRLTDQGLVAAIAIDARRIEVIVPKVERAGEEALAILVAWRRAISPAQRHAAKANGVGLVDQQSCGE